MTGMQWTGLVFGLLILLSRLPGVVWPEQWVAASRQLLALPVAVRVLGGMLVALAGLVCALLAHTLTFFQTVMLVLAVACAGGGTVTLLFPEAYGRFGERLLNAMPLPAVRVVTALASLLGLWIVYMSLTLT